MYDYLYRSCESLLSYFVSTQQVRLCWCQSVAFALLGLGIGRPPFLIHFHELCYGCPRSYHLST